MALAWALTGILVCDGAEPSSADVLTPAEREQFFARYFERMNAPKPLTRFTSVQQWESYRKQLREKIQQAIGLVPPPERVPLLPQITGRLDHDDYSVERVYYQVMPGVLRAGTSIGRSRGRA